MVSISTIQSFVKASGVKSILQTKPHGLKGFNSAELKYASLEKDTFQSIDKVQEKVCLLKSKTFSKLFSKEFKPINNKTVEGFPITTVIDKQTGMPVEVYFKKSPDKIEIRNVGDIGNKQKVEVPIEEWVMFKKSPSGDDEKLGFVNWTVDKDNKKFGVGFIGNQIEYDKYYTGKIAKDVESKYLGIGVRLNQIKIERFLQEKFRSLEILSSSTAYPFHAKNGFKIPSDIKMNVYPLTQYDGILKRFENITGLDIETIKPIAEKFIKKSNQDFSLSSEFLNQLYSLSYIKTGNKRFGDIPMTLPKESLGFWKNLIENQSILS